MIISDFLYIVKGLGRYLSDPLWLGEVRRVRRALNVLYDFFTCPEGTFTTDRFLLCRLKGRYRRVTQMSNDFYLKHKTQSRSQSEKVLQRVRNSLVRIFTIEIINTLIMNATELFLLVMILSRICEAPDGPDH